MTKLIVGLGNVGTKYSLTRHNIGFRFIEYFLSTNYQSETSFNSIGFKSSKFSYLDNEVITFRSNGFMNNSGIGISNISKYFKIDPKDIIIIHDEIDLEFGDVRSKIGGGDNGHNGLRSITNQLGTKEYFRIRAGVSRPQNPHIDIADYVLSNFTNNEENNMQDFFIDINKELDNILSK